MWLSLMVSTGAGSSLLENERFHQPAFQSPDVIDTTGSAMPITGPFLLGLLKGLAYGIQQNWPAW